MAIVDGDTGGRHRAPRRIAYALARAPGLFALANTIWSLLPTQGATIMRTADVRAAGGYGDRSQGEDWALGAALAWRGRVRLSHEAGLVYRWRFDSPGREGADADLLANARFVRERLRRDPAVPADVRRAAPLVAVAQWAAVAVVRPLPWRCAASSRGRAACPPPRPEARAARAARAQNGRRIRARTSRPRLSPARGSQCTRNSRGGKSLRHPICDASRRPRRLRHLLEPQRGRRRRRRAQGDIDRAEAGSASRSARRSPAGVSRRPVENASIAWSLAARAAARAMSLRRHLERSVEMPRPLPPSAPCWTACKTTCRARAGRASAGASNPATGTVAMADGQRIPVGLGSTPTPGRLRCRSTWTPSDSRHQSLPCSCHQSGSVD